MKYKILVIDDGEFVHIVSSSLLGDEFVILKTKRSQQASLLLLNVFAHLLMLDIHIPGFFYGLDLFKSIQSDLRQSKMSSLILSRSPGTVKKRSPSNSGKADQIRKKTFFEDQEKFLRRIKIALASNVPSDSREDFLEKRNDFILQFQEAISTKKLVTFTRFQARNWENIFSGYTGYQSVRDGYATFYLAPPADLKQGHFQANRRKNKREYNFTNETKQTYLSNNALVIEKEFIRDFQQLMIYLLKLPFILLVLMSVKCYWLKRRFLLTH